MNEPILSIYIATFNHEKYIAKALDSVLMQKTQYSFEVLVGEDASQDGTRAILKDYEQKYPGFFTIFYRETNMHQCEVNNIMDLMQRCRGKYIIALEGDDFWTDENKLERQIAFLESHPDYLGVAHNCIVVGEDSLPNGEVYQECMDSEYSLRHYVSEIMPGQLATVMYRNFMYLNDMDFSIMKKNLSPGDRLVYFALAAQGKLHCIQQSMSAYRHVVDHGSSFSATNRYSFQKDEQWCKALLEYAMNLPNPDAKKYAKLIYFRALIQGMKRRQLNWKGFLHYLSNLDTKGTTAALYIRSFVAHHVLKCKLWV